MAAVSYDQSAAAKAGNFGWSLAVINSDPELKALFAQATATGPNGGWTVDHFVAKVRDTKWFKTHADTARQAIILQKADPATYNSRVGSAAAQVTAMAGQVGARLTAAQVQQVGVDSVMFGWNSDQLRQHLTPYVKSATVSGAANQYTGGAATLQYQYQQMAGQYGVTVSPQVMGYWVKNTTSGSWSADDVRNHMVALATSRYPALSDRIKAGETLQSIADPYMQSYAKILEVNPNTLSLNDNLVQGALSGVDAQGKPAAKSVWQFEQDLRNDPRYMKTQQAQDKAYSMAKQVLTDFGVKS